MIAAALNDTHCRECKAPLVKRGSSVECQCISPETGGCTPHYGGSLDLTDHGTGIVRCTRCGWEGLPVYEPGGISTYCPTCEREGEDPDWRDVFCGPGEVLMRVTRRGIQTYGRMARRRRSAPKVSRNASCPCGSGLKFKRCHGR